MTSEGCSQHLGTTCVLRGGEPVVHIVWREQPKPAVMVLRVVPGEEVAAEAASVLSGEPKRSGKSGRYFSDSELRPAQSGAY